MSRQITSLFLATLLLQGCSAIKGLLPTDPPSVETVSTVPPEQTYNAPTLPPEYTLTPTVTLSPTSPPSPTPFQVVTVEETGEPEEGAPPTATPVLFVGQWEPYESRRIGASIRIPPELEVYDYGQGIRVGDPGVLSGDSLLFLEILLDQSNSYRLPYGIDATNPRNVLEAVIREVEQDFTEFQLVRPIRDVDFNGISASEVAARASLETSNSEININWYLAVAIRDETVVRFYGSSPSSAGVTYITVAERIADSFSFIE